MALGNSTMASLRTTRRSAAAAAGWAANRPATMSSNGNRVATRPNTIALGRIVLAKLLVEVGFDKRAKVAVEHRLNVAGAELGPVVTDQRVGVQHVGAN